ncbi:uncharacterized protein RCH25_044687 isoform 2-T2 [Pelodytes ibericus]
MSDFCRLCASPLRGSRRKWLFGGSGSLPALFSHVLGSPVTRAQSGASPKYSRGKDKPEDCEFICGKCSHTLNVYQRYDMVMSRMRQLYDQRSTRLFSEREKLSFTLRRIHAKAWNLPLPDYQGYGNECRTPGYGSYNDLRSMGQHRSRNNSPGYHNLCPDSPFPDQQSSFHGSFGSLSSGTPSKSYQQLMDHDRSTWEHESWWEDRGDACNRCIKGDKCHSCSSWRVPDSNYETVCTVPRRKKHGKGDDGQCCSSGLLRSKSLGSFGGGGGGSSRGSLLSFSTSSLEALSVTGEEEEPGVFWEPQSPLTSPPPSLRPVMGEALKTLKEIKSNPVVSPGRSRIPVMRRGSMGTGPENGGRKVDEGRRLEVPLVEVTEDWDTFAGIGSEVCQTQVTRSLRIQETLRWFRTQLQAAQANDDPQGQKTGQQDLVRELLKSLHFKEEVLEDCLTLLLTQSVTPDPSSESLMTLVENLREQDQQMKREWRDLAEDKQQRKAEQLQLELIKRQEDLERLSRVLRENQDTITALRDLLGEKDFTIQQLEVALDSAIRSAASQDALRLSALREKDALISAMQGVLSSSNQDVEALADSLLSQGLDDLGGSVPGMSSPSPLITQLQEKGRLLSEAQADNQKQSAQHQKNIQDLLNALNESQTLLQVQLQYCKERLRVGEEEQRRLREALRGREAELRAEKQKHCSDMHDTHMELVQLHGTARERDKTTQKLLQEAQSRDQTIKRLQERLSQGGGMRDTL